MSVKYQFDSILGGTSQLPSEISYFRYAAARIKEIEFLKKSLKSRKGSKLAFQKLPKHMRRRAMSHNAKRLPRRLRQIHQNQLEKSGLPQKQKRSCRKFKRRPNNLMQEYARRQKNRIWLNTHLWHAKRFHMVEKWGYRLPDRPCDKAFRACFRATTKYCLLQDISYYSCIEISGKYDLIIDKFDRITNKHFGLSVGAKAFSKGNKEGCVNLLRLETPHKVIGQVYFSWRPRSNQDSDENCIWLWVHAAFYQEVLDTLLHLFLLHPSQADDDTNTEHVKHYINHDSNIQLSELKIELNRFRLTGPLSTAVIQNCFKPSDANTYSSDAAWFRDYLDSNEKRQIYVNQVNYWSQLKYKRAAEVPPHTIVSTIVEDPRVNLPKKRTKSAMDNLDGSYLDPPNFDGCFSELWDQTTRRLVKESKLSNAKICEMRSKYLVPGSDVDDNLRTPVPLMFVQRPGCRCNNIGYGGGWDIILPASWAQPIWVSLIMWGARAGGLREASLIRFEMGHQHILLPDTAAGKKEEAEFSQRYQDKYFRKPPNRRLNYKKFSISHPFQWDWQMLIRDWKDGAVKVEDFIVLRDKKILNDIQTALSRGNLDMNCEFLSQNYLVPVHMKCLSKGQPMKFGVICLPHPEDHKKLPVEPLRTDPNQQQRKEHRKKHKVLLKQLRQRRIRAKKLGKDLPVDKDMLQEYTSKMRKLWLPEPTELRHSCSRQVIGLIRHGDFSFSAAQGTAVGYIAIAALPHLFKLKQRNVLLRNTTSRQYRLATINVICE